MKILRFNDDRLGVLKGADRVVDISAVISHREERGPQRTMEVLIENFDALRADIQRIVDIAEGAPFMLAPRGTAGPMGQTRMLTYGIIQGGHVRLGTQDMAWYSDGVPAQSNAQIVARIARISRELGREVASTDDARRILGVPPRA